ncbi:hypothetical protein FEM48_Zijuj03G0189300 [Ziziphus jujuba var. spinosa]|uniref:Uncharacterized protein n=1 Tax=Ziziphus jujuba var. spinosa TaxID=714518 RepID=A0A978VS16_ZIZJJ|nr:hypothetical protein FEM48_Zijuj03G0189300 [Ziziphus jujuba var. spinosa]
MRIEIPLIREKFEVWVSHGGAPMYLRSESPYISQRPKRVIDQSKVHINWTHYYVAENGGCDCHHTCLFVSTKQAQAYPPRHMAMSIGFSTVEDNVRDILSKCGISSTEELLGEYTAALARVTQRLLPPRQRRSFRFRGFSRPSSTAFAPQDTFILYF